MAAIDTLISLADVRGTLDLRCQFQGDWALDHYQEPAGTSPYHIVLAGHCHIEMANRQRLTLTAGDILVLPQGSQHVLSSPGQRVTPSRPRRETDAGLLPVQR